MRVNWAQWQQPIGGNCNYNFQSQSFHFAVLPQLSQTKANTSWLQQLQQIHPGFLAQYQQQLLSSYGQFGSAANTFNPFANYNQSYTGYNNYNNRSSNQTKTFTGNEPSKTVETSSDSVNNNEQTMEPKDFVTATRFNAFAVNFKNLNAISEDQVHDIFSVYGKIKRVKQTGDEHGLCFVNFENEEDAIKASAGVKNHPDIKLRPAKFNRSKNFSEQSSLQNNFNNGSGKNGNDGFNDDNGNNFSNDNGRNNYSNRNDRKNYSNGHSDNYSNGNGKKNYYNGNRGNNYSNDNSKYDNFNKSDDKIFETTSDKFPVPASNQLQTEIKITETTEISNYDKEQKNTTTLQSSDSPISTSEPAVNNHDIEKCDQHPTIFSKSEIQIPDLVARKSKISLAGSRDSVDSFAAMVPVEKMATEVLVANIQEGINLHAILQLFDNYHPLAATNILTYKPSNLRYCRVYFTSLKRAEDVEAEFNNCILMDKPLFVVRAAGLVN